MPGLITRREICFCVRICLAIVAMLASELPFARAEWREEIGYNKLAALLGDALPRGAGVPISLVEAQVAGTMQYFPDVTLSDFNENFDPLSTAVNFIDGSGGRINGKSNHASDQARFFFGNTTSVAPIANEVTVYEANDWLTDILNLNASTTEPDAQDFRVQNFSWIGTFATPNDGTPEPTAAELDNDRKALRKFDFVIERDNITAFVGVHNVVSPLPHLLSHSYNSIALGRSDGAHSTGLTHLEDYGIGRSKPDLVSPQASTSAATSSASSVATFLHSSDTVRNTDAAQSQTMKAILLAGASKDTLPSWSQLDGSGEWHPLDETYGAGELNMFDSYAITVGGRGTGTTATPTPVASHGWDYQVIQPGTGNELLYDLIIPTGSTAAELSIALAWNAQISSPFSTGDPVVADLNLELVDSNGLTIDTNLADTYVDGLSASDVDNVEHIYLTDLGPGTYTLKVSSDDLASEFGLAWRTSTLFDSTTADFNDDGSVDGSDYLAWQVGYGTLVNATRADGDANGDGHVDADDLVIFRDTLSTVNPSLASSLFSVPEPSTLAIAGCGFLLYGAGRIRRLFSR